MANGKRGDHPLTDILHHEIPVFSDSIDEAVRELAQLVPEEIVRDAIDWFDPPALEELEVHLRERIAKARADARARGWEISPQPASGSQDSEEASRPDDVD